MSRCRLAVSNETILAARQESFFAKVAPVQSITDIALLHFWLMLPPWMFVSSYFTIYFFVKKFFFEYLSFSEYNIWMFFLRKLPSIKYVRNQGRCGRVIQNACSCVQGEANVMPHAYARAYTVFFHVFGSILVLWCLVSFTEI